MTPENKKVVKIIAISVGIVLVVSVVTVLIIKQVEKNRAKKEAEKNGGSDSGDSKPSASGSGTSSDGSYSTNSFGGRTFSQAEIVKMQSYLFNLGAMAMNDTIVSAIRDSGGFDGKIGNGFKTAYNEAIRIGIIQSLNDLYTQAMNH